DLEWCNFDPTATVAAVRSFGPRASRAPELLEGVCLPSWGSHIDALIETGPAYGMDIRQDHRRQLHWLRSVAPHYLLSYPSNLEVLAGLARQDGSLPGLRAIQAFSDTLTEEARATIEAAFGVPVKNLYSCAEAGYLASPCPAGHGLHVHAENV